MKSLESLREEEVLALEEDLLRRLEERLAPLVEQAAKGASKIWMHQFRLDLIAQIMRQ